MKLELQSASNFLVHLIRLGRRNLNDAQLEKFRLALIEVLRRRYRDHWFPERPFKGSGYRCIRINGKMDPVIVQAGDSAGLAPTLIHATFPSELTMWIDPLEVSYRIGENGSICVLYEFKENCNEAWKPTVTCASSSSTNSSATISKAGSTGSSPSSTSSTPPPTMVAPSSNLNNKNSQVARNDNEVGVTLNRNVVNAGGKSSAACGADSMRKMDYLLDPRKSVSIEQLAAYVSS